MALGIRQSFKILAPGSSLRHRLAYSLLVVRRAHEDDHILNAVLETIRQEIKYPLVRPVVSGLSQQYFWIHPELNLLCVPLTEGQFLLHLPSRTALLVLA